MFDEFVLEVFFIKIKVKSSLENMTEKKTEKIETFAIRNKNKIKFYHNETKIDISIDNDKLTLIRENDNFIHKFEFKLNKETKSEYYIKEYSSSIEVNILTTNLLIKDKRIEINYIIKDSNDEYYYILDME